MILPDSSPVSTDSTKDLLITPNKAHHLVAVQKLVEFTLGAGETNRMHSGDLSEFDQASLSEQEKETLLQVMERAKVAC